MLCREYCDEEYGLPICRKHALMVWSLIERERQESALSVDDVRKRQESLTQAERAKAEEKEAAFRAEGWIYYVRLDGCIKIGHTKDLDTRIRSYGPLAVVEAVERGSLRDEKNLHMRFADLRAYRREWYRPSARFEDHIARVREANADLTGSVIPEAKREPRPMRPRQAKGRVVQ